MKIIDITGLIYTGMWDYGPPFPSYQLKEIPNPEWLSYKVYMEEFAGLSSQTGTYLETPAHSLGYEKSYPLIDVPVEKLVNVPTYVIQLDMEKLPLIDGRRAITKQALLDNCDEKKMKDCRCILVSTGWGKFWKEKNYAHDAPFFKYEAMEWIVSKRPFMLAADSSRWENIKKFEGFFPIFFGANILMLAPCVNTEKISREVVELTVLPLKIEKTCCVPCRAIVMEK